MAAVLEFDPAVSNAVCSALGVGNTVLFHDASQVAAHVREHGDPVVVIGPSVDAAVATRLTSQLTAEFPQAGVIWLRRRVDTTTVLEAVRAGASDVVGEGDLPALVSAANRVVQKASAFASQAGGAAGPQRGTVTAVYAPKGGCGKTSFATNLAAMLAHEQRQRVAVIDLDLESGDVQLLMAMVQGRSISDLTNLADTLDAASLGSAMLPHSSGAYVLAAPRRPEDASLVSGKLVNRVIELAATMFDHVIVDCPPYATEHVLSVLDVADELALMCTPDAASVKNTALALEMLTELNFAGRISLVINHAGDKVGITSADIGHALAHQVDCQIPSSLDLPTATNTGKLLTTSNPKHPISMAIRSWAATLNGAGTPGGLVATVEEPAVVPAQAKRGRLRFKRVATA